MLDRFRCVTRISGVVVASVAIMSINGQVVSAQDSIAVRSSAIYDWHLAPSLLELRTEINARWPGRDRSSDGAVGDERHQARVNSHNPARYPAGPAVGTVGAVHALDVTARGVDVQALLSAVVGDPRIWYVIHGGQIWSRSNGWAPRTHRGDPHANHIHINLREDSQEAAVAAETDTRAWFGSQAAPTGGGPTREPAPASVSGLSRAEVKTLQLALIRGGYSIPAGATGWYGPQTKRAVAAFQRAQGWSGDAADGIAGTRTIQLLAGSVSPEPKVGRGAIVSDAYRPGVASREVYFMQEALIARGHTIPAGSTGYFGARTVAAVKDFQRSLGLTGKDADGVPGGRTLRALGLI
jgi:peptidoglycan hydrolase-like protein with peptidoglycan-binding domain